MTGIVTDPDVLRDLRIRSANLIDEIEEVLFRNQLSRPLSANLTNNMAVIQGLTHQAADLQFTKFACRGGLQGAILFAIDFVNYELMVAGIVEPLTGLNWTQAEVGRPLLEQVAKTIAPVGGAEAVDNVKGALDSIWSGGAVVFLDGTSGAVSINVGKINKRSITRPVSEQVVMGPHAGFIEDGMTNLSLVRQRLKTPRLWIDRMHVGRHTRTAVYLLSLYGVTDGALVDEVKSRLCQINIDGVLDSNYLVELVKSDRWTIFPTVLRTERPDRVAAGLLEGRVAIIVDGSPLAIVAPATLPMMMTSAADYYQNWMVATFLRIVRYIALTASLLTPGLYVALTTYHQEAIPTPLLITMAAARSDVPLPAVGEVLLLMVLFDIIREAGARVPTGIGSALTIGGTLVVGQAAVRAGIISSPIIIVVAGIVIAVLAIPNPELVQAVRFATYPVILGGAILGVYGILFVTIGLALHLASLESFGVAYLSPAAPIRPTDFKDFIIRLPWFRQTTRPAQTGYTDVMRQGPRSS